MGTRSLTFVHDDDAQQSVLACVYRQFDGYPEGLGIEHAEFLKQIKLINGIGSGQQVAGKFANGMGCLAAQLIEHMKDHQVGSVYLYPVDTTDAGSEYHYHVRQKDGQILLEVASVNHGRMVGDKYVPYSKTKLKVEFKGTPEQVLIAINEAGNKAKE